MTSGNEPRRIAGAAGALLFVLSLAATACQGQQAPAGSAATAPASRYSTEAASPLQALPALLSAPSARLPEIESSAFSTLRGFYAGRGYEALWVGPAGLKPAGEALRARLARARSAGQVALAPLLTAIEARSRDAAGRRSAELELLLSAALLQGAVNPRDPAAAGNGPEILRQAAEAADLGALLPAILPVDAAFWRLRQAIPAYREIEASGGWPSVAPGPKLELGESGPRVESLRRRLLVTGELAGTAGNPEVFDRRLDEAVRAFQARHGLLVDGIVGERTLAALNVPVEARLAVIDLNLRRLLEQRRDWGQRYIAVNVAAAAYRLVEGGRPVIERAAIVGRPSWPTPQLEGLIDRLEFNPYWTVPPRITRLEVLPKARRDPDYLRRNDMHWVGGQIRQNPGPKNPLGKVKFLFANPYSVYLHDTNSRQLFERAARFLSHGCVRVSGALEIARHLLKGDASWPPQRIEEVLQGWRTERVDLTTPMPLHIVYDTAWVEEDGTVNFRDDVYALDRYPARADAAAPAPGQQAPILQACASESSRP